MNFEFWHQRGFSVIPIIPKSGVVQDSRYFQYSNTLSIPGIKKGMVWIPFEKDSDVVRGTSSMRNQWQLEKAGIGIFNDKIVTIEIDCVESFFVEEVRKIIFKLIGKSPILNRSSSSISLFYLRNGNIPHADFLVFEKFNSTITSDFFLRLRIKSHGYTVVWDNESPDNLKNFPNGLFYSYQLNESNQINLRKSIGTLESRFIKEGFKLLNGRILPKNYNYLPEDRRWQ
jgi:hypothetical protein